MRLFTFGYGFSAAALGARLKTQGWSLAATYRREETKRARRTT
ncbi:hypothetical protein [Phenylobacterium sp.]|nr:hypothetical protein [Phenylobacterium sp.]MDP1986109.1 hypothetical protein [Phenylobacterium sp.]